MAIMELPEQLIASLKNIPGFEEAAFKAVHESGEQITSVRLNSNKIFNIQYSILNGHQDRVPWSTQGYYLPRRPSFTLDPQFHAGAYYVQEASSMFLEQALKQTIDLEKRLKILDLCAAPGGKSTLIQSLITEDSLLVSNEVIKARVNVLAENMTKWGSGNVIVTNNDPKDFQRLEKYFDAIVVDAPCSGSGLFRKDPDAIAEWSENNVALCGQRQQRILTDVLPALKEGGVLVYSTCSYSLREDEDISEWLVMEMGLESLALELDPQWGIIETRSARCGANGYRFYPDRLKGEGFFIAAFRKKNTGGHEWRSGRANKRPDTVSQKEIDTIAPFLNRADGLFFIRQGDELIAMPDSLKQDLAVIQDALYIKKAGVKIGQVIRTDLVPDHELALSNLINPSVDRIDVDLETALQYLRKEELKIKCSGTGWHLVCYQQLPLGWVKILPNRVNNYYPSAWRILNK